MAKLQEIFNHRIALPGGRHADAILPGESGDSESLHGAVPEQLFAKRDLPRYGDGLVEDGPDNEHPVPPRSDEIG